MNAGVEMQRNWETVPAAEVAALATISKEVLSKLSEDKKTQVKATLEAMGVEL